MSPEVPGGWRDLAACSGLATRDCDPWFPLPDDADDDRPPRWECEAAYAIRICVRCRVRTECLTEALTSERANPTRARSGIFGGLTPTQRARLDPRRHAPRNPSPVRKTA